MTKTMRKVTMVVKLSTASCHGSENPNSGPLPPHPISTSSAAMKAHGGPTIAAITPANLRKNLFVHAS